MLLLLFGWLTSKAPGVWSLLVGLAVAIPAVAPLFERSARYLHGSIRGWRGAFDEVVRAAVLLAFLPHQAWLSVDAIVRVTYRRWISRHHLLEWQTTDSAARNQSQLSLHHAPHAGGVWIRGGPDDRNATWRTRSLPLHSFWRLWALSRY